VLFSEAADKSPVPDNRYKMSFATKQSIWLRDLSLRDMIDRLS
jgi:hypothetical protein